MAYDTYCPLAYEAPKPQRDPLETPVLNFQIWRNKFPQLSPRSLARSRLLQYLALSTDTPDPPAALGALRPAFPDPLTRNRQ